jgi:response regulator RpfG family c-di-GMP phosphodiesterase
MGKNVILCVDDEKMILDSIKSQLKEKYGKKYQYETADNAEDALELIDELVEESVSIIVIVSDWLMPGIKGDELLIKIHQKNPEIVKIMLTGQADKEAIERAKNKANLHKCLFKPWKDNELFDAIESGLKN